MPSTSNPADRAKVSGRDRRVQVRDFLRSEGVAVASPDRQLSLDDTLIRGDFLHVELRPGLFLHYSNVMEEHAFTATSVLHEGLSCIFFLNGQVDLRIGDRSFEFSGNDQSAMTGTVIMNTRDERFQRSSKCRQYLRHLVVSATPEWLDLDGMASVDRPSGGAGILRDHLSNHRWVATPKTVDLVRQILSPSPLVPELRNLYIEGRAVEIVTESLAAAMQADRRGEGGAILSQQDRIRLLRAIDIIKAHLETPLSVEMIAREAGISPSGLQKLFRLSEQKSVFEYVRELRLERAFAALKADRANVQQASLIAGYSNPANFATAFRKRFGTTPRQVSRPIDGPIDPAP